MKKRIDVFFFFLLLIIAVFFSFYRIDKKVVLSMYNAENGKTIEIPLQNNEFTHVFIHSIQKTPVYEDFKVENKKKLHLIRVRYFSLGVGLPYAEEGKFENKNGEFVMELNRQFDTLQIRVSPLKGHGIIAN